MIIPEVTARKKNFLVQCTNSGHSAQSDGVEGRFSVHIVVHDILTRISGFRPLVDSLLFAALKIRTFQKLDSEMVKKIW